MERCEECLTSTFGAEPGCASRVAARFRAILVAGELTAGSAASVELVEDRLDRHLHAGEDRDVALGVGGGLGAPELLHELEELRHGLPLEGDAELLVVDAERVPRVHLHVGEAVAALEARPPHAPAPPAGQPLP